MVMFIFLKITRLISLFLRFISCCRCLGKGRKPLSPPLEYKPHQSSNLGHEETAKDISCWHVPSVGRQVQKRGEGLTSKFTFWVEHFSLQKQDLMWWAGREFRNVNPAQWLIIRGWTDILGTFKNVRGCIFGCHSDKGPALAFKSKGQR